MPLIPKKLPRTVSEEFGNIEICIEAFSLNRALMLRKRERCFFVRASGINYIFKKRLFGKVIKVELIEDAYVERTFRFVRFFTYRASQTKYKIANVAVRREHSGNFDEIVSRGGLINYNQILEERRQKRAEEMTAKVQQAKDDIAKTAKATGDGFRNVFSSIGKKKSKCDICGSKKSKLSDEGCTDCSFAVTQD